MRLPFFLLLAAAVLGADEGKPPAEREPPKTAGEVEIPDPGTPIEDAAIARREVSRFHKEWKEQKDAEQRIQLLDRLGRFDHPEILKAATKHIRDKDHTVAVAAVATVARQPGSKDQAGRTLLGALKREKRTHVVCALLVGMGRLGYDHKSAVNEAEKYFKKDTTETHKAATRYLGYVKHKPAFRMLAEKLDEPIAKNPNDPTNPPASWWKERWEEWSTNVKYTRWAISELVEGETFETTNEAKTWAENHGRDHGIEW